MTRKDGVCRATDLAKCLEEHDEDDLEWTCAHCPRTPDTDIHPYTRKLLRLRLLQLAGYPIASEFLTYDEWIDLGKVNQCLGMKAQSLLALR